MIFKTLFLLVLILINGVFSSCEIAYLSIDKIKLNSDKAKLKNARIASRLCKDTNRFLATIQVAITFAGFLASAFAADAYVSYIIDVFDIKNKVVFEPIIMVVITIILSYITLLFGELLPKRIGLSNPNFIAYKMAKILLIARFIFTPFVYVLTKSVNVLAHVLKIKDVNSEELTEESLKRTIAFGRDQGILEVNETNILMNVFEFNDTKVSKVMTKEEDVVYIDLSEKTSDIMKKFNKYKYTSYPITDKEEVVGVLNIKDLIVSESKLIKNVMKKPVFVNQSDEIDHVFLKMKKNDITLMAVIGGGIITQDDIIEELLGNIKEEFN